MKKGIVLLVGMFLLNSATGRNCHPRSPENISQIDFQSKDICQTGTIEMLAVPRSINPGHLLYERNGLRSQDTSNYSGVEGPVAYPTTRKTVQTKVDARAFIAFFYNHTSIQLSADYSQGNNITIELDLGNAASMKKLSREEFEQKIVQKQMILKDLKESPESSFIYDTILYSDSIKYKFLKTSVVKGEASINLANLAGIGASNIIVNLEEYSITYKRPERIAVLYCKTQITQSILDDTLRRNKPSIEYVVMLQDSGTCNFKEKDGSNNHLSAERLVYAFGITSLKNFPENCSVEYSAKTALGLRGPVTSGCVGENGNNLKSISAKLIGTCPTDWHIKYNRNYRPGPSGSNVSGKGEWRHSNCDGSFTDDEANSEGKIVGLEFRINPEDGCP